MTRPLSASRAFVDALPAHLTARLDIILTPLLRIEPTGQTAPLSDTDAVIFTSSNGVRFAPDGAGRTAFCVGAATTKAATTRGWRAIERGTTAHSLAQNLSANPPHHKVYHLSGIHTRGDITGRLRAVGVDAHRVALYDQVTCDLSAPARNALAGERGALIPLFSPRTAAHFFGQVPALSQGIVIAMSDAVAATAPDSLRAQLIVSVAPDANAMAKALEDAADCLAAG